MIEKSPNIFVLSGMPLHEITNLYGTEGLISRYNYEVGKLPEEDQWQLNQAFLSAAEWHKDQKRTTGPYIDHILRVMLRVLSHYNVTDPDILTAALLHDSVEDQRDKIVGHQDATVEEALEVISDLYNPRVASILRALTNPPGDVTREEYDAHVRKSLINEPDAIPVKISDVADNAVGIFWTKGDGKKLKLSNKYLPLIPFYESLVSDGVYEFQADVQRAILRHLDSARLRMSDIIKLAGRPSIGDEAIGQL